MLIWPALLGSLVGGWAGGPGLGARGPARQAGLCFPLGIGLWLGWVYCLAWLLSATSALLSASVLAALHGYWLGLRRQDQNPTWFSWPQGVLLLLLGLVSWLFLVGGFQLAPERNFLLFDLPRIAQLHSGQAVAAHPLGPDALVQVTPFSLAASAGGDPLGFALILGGVCQVASVLGCLLLLTRFNKAAPLAVVLGSLALFLGSAQGWSVTRSPADGPVHLLAIMGLWLLLERRYLAALPLLVGLSPVHGRLTLAVVGAALLPKRWRLAAVLLGLPLAGYIDGISLGLLAAAVLCWRHPNRLIRGFALAEFLCPGVFGLVALGLAAGRAVTVLWRRYPGQRLAFRLRPEMALNLPCRGFLVALAGLLVWHSMAAGEEILNDDVLIFSHRQKVSLGQLFRPRTLQQWARWRGSAIGLTEGDLKAAEQLGGLQGPAVYLTGEPQEKVEVAALVCALSGGHPLAGWYAANDGAALLPALASTAATGDPEFLRSTSARWLLRRDLPKLAIEPWPRSGAAGPVVVAPSRLASWGQLHWFETRGDAAFEVWRDGQPFGPDFGLRRPGGGALPFALPPLPGSYTLRWRGGPKQTFVSPSSLPLTASLQLSPELPSRSLIEARLELRNRAEVTLDLGDLRAARLQLNSLIDSRWSEIAPLTPLQGLSLPPGESRTLTLWLRTAKPVGSYGASLELFDALGRVHRVELDRSVLHTWRRQPLVAVPGGQVEGH